jgi:membrane peptidoglycan carboxypeptidase
MPGGDRSNLPDYYTHGSNLYSAQEGVLLRWLEVHNELYQSGGLNQPQQQQQISSTPGQRLMTFDKDLRDGWFLATLIQSYVGQNAAKYFQGMKLKCFLDEDYQANAQKVFKALQEINLQTPFD